ncbi:MAG: ISL3 family transposase, partial [Janthinobacterium lividum]
TGGDRSCERPPDFTDHCRRGVHEAASAADAATPRQVAKVQALKDASPDFVAMRRFVMRFRGIMRSGDIDKLAGWIDDVRHSGIYAMQRFGRSLLQDLDAVRHAITEPWSNGQTEGQINRLKTLKRAMYGRAGVELLRARMMPLLPIVSHTD